MQNLSENELILTLIQDPESLALNTLFNKYKPMVINLFNSYHFRYLDLDDALAIGLKTCFYSTQHFDFNKHVTFGAFFKNNLQNEFRSILRKQNAKKRESDLNSYTYNDLSNIAEEQPEFNLRHLSSHEQMLLKEQLKSVTADFSYLENRVFYNYLNNTTSYKAAKDLQISERTYQNAVNRCRNKIKRSFKLD